MIYLYGLGERGAESSAELGSGVGGEAVAALDCGGLVAIVGELQSAPAVSPESLAAHDATVRRAAAWAPAFLPARFGQSFPAAPALAQAIAAEAPALLRALGLVRGCAQMTVRLFQPDAGSGDPAHADDARTPESEPAADLGVGPAGPGTRFLAARRAAAAAAASLPELEPARKMLAPLIRAERVRRSAVPGFVGTAYHLVSTADVGRYLAIAKAAPAGAGRRLAVSGPWPAYAFAPEVLA